MKIDDAIAAIKEFFLELVGFLLPGITLLLLSYLFLKNEFKAEIDGFLVKENSSTIVLIISYILGYVLYGISETWLSTKNWFFKSYKKLRNIEIKSLIDEV